MLKWLIATALLMITNTAWAEEAHSPLPPFTQVIDDVMSIDIGTMSLWRVLVAMGILMAGILLRTTLLAKLMHPLVLLARKTKTSADDSFLAAARRPLGWVLNLIAIYLAILVIQPPETLLITLVLVLKTMGTVFVAWVIFGIVDALSAYLGELAARTDTKLDDHFVPLLKRVMRIVVVSVTVITIIQQWGYDVTSLIAGLGLGGLAFALAAQSTLSNWFGSVMILTDRPFLVGQLIRSQHGDGRIVEIGMRSTRIRTFKGTIVTVPNSDIATSPIENINAFPTMNIQTEIGLMYSTPRPKIERIVARIREELSADELVDSDRVLVCFSGFGDSSLNILIHCFAFVDDWWTWHQAREKLFLKVMTIVEEEGASFAFPSQSLYFENPLELANKTVEKNKGT